MGDSFKKQVAITVLTATVSMAAGFFIVYLLVGPTGSDGSEEVRTDEGKLPEPGKKQEAGPEALPENKSPEAAPGKAGGGSDKGTPGAVPGAAGAGEGTKQPGKAQPAEEAKPTPEPAPAKAAGGATAAGLTMTDHFVFRCWSQGEETPVEREACGTLAGIEGLVENRLDGIGKCVKKYGGGSGGRISLALKIDFTKNRYRAWLGKSSTIEGVEETSACIRQLYSDVPWESMEHTFVTYIVFFNIDVN